MSSTPSQIVRTRVAPSPTGFPHLGLVYQAMFDYVLAKKYDGKFVLRIEDTDQSRFVEGAEDVIHKSLSWAGLTPDEGPEMGGDLGPYRQSERLAIYKKYAEELIEKGHAYRCFCTRERLEQMRKQQEAEKKAPMYDRTCRNLTHEDIEKNLHENLSFVIRMKMPDDETIVMHDEIVGDVSFESKQLDEQVIVKSDGFPTYHLAVVVDDHLMEISHVFRGTEWLPSAPKHILLYRYLGWTDTMPKFIHIPLLLNSQGGGKLSKRLAHTSVDFYKNEGFLPQAVVNYLANIVWNHPEEKEIFPLMDFGKAMTLDPFTIDIKSTGVKFDLQKLTWINGMYIRDVLSSEELQDALCAFTPELEKMNSNMLMSFIDIAKTRIKTLKEFKEMIDPFLDPKPVTKTDEQKIIASQIVTDLEKLAEWEKETIADVIIKKYVQAKVVSFKDLYLMLLGIDKGLPLSDMFAVMGKEKTLALFH